MEQLDIMQKQEIFGISNDDNTVSLYHCECGEAVTRLDEDMPMVWPVNSDLSGYYEHPNGIIITLDTANSIGLAIESATG